MSVSATECERIAPEFLEEARRVKTRDYDQAVFDTADIEAAVDSSYTEIPIGR